MASSGYSATCIFDTPLCDLMCHLLHGNVYPPVIHADYTTCQFGIVIIFPQNTRSKVLTHFTLRHLILGKQSSRASSTCAVPVLRNRILCKYVSIFIFTTSWRQRLIINQAIWKCWRYSRFYSPLRSQTLIHVRRANLSEIPVYIADKKTCEQ